MLQSEPQSVSPGTCGTEAANKTVFIVGMPRCGTTWTMMLLAQHPRIAVLQQSGLFHALQPLHLWWQSRGGYGKRVVSYSEVSDEHGKAAERRDFFVGDLLHNNDLNEFCKPVLQYVYDRVRGAVAGSSVVVDQTPENLEFAEWILQLVPDAYFLHMVRDPRAVYASMRAANATWATGSFPHQPEAVGTLWRTYAEKIRDLKKQTDRVIEVRYEDMIDDGQAQLSRILSWLQLEFDNSFVEKALQNCSIEKLRQASVAPPTFFRRGTARSWRNEVSRLQAACVEYGAHPFMETYGYPLTSVRRERAPLPVRIRASMQRIVAPAIESIRQLRKRARKLAGH